MAGHGRRRGRCRPAGSARSGLAGLASCGGQGSPASSSATAVASASSATVAERSLPGLGLVLVTSTGMTLYLLTSPPGRSWSPAGRAGRPVGRRGARSPGRPAASEERRAENANLGVWTVPPTRSSSPTVPSACPDLPSRARLSHPPPGSGGADRFARWLLRVGEPGTGQDVHNLFSSSIALSATRCLLSYIVFPVLAPWVGPSR